MTRTSLLAQVSDSGKRVILTIHVCFDCCETGESSLCYYMVAELVKEVFHQKEQLNKNESLWMRKSDDVANEEYASFHNWLFLTIERITRL